MEANGLEEIEKEREAVAELAQSIAELDKEAKEREADIKKLQGVEHNQRKEFENYLAAFTAE